MNELSTYLKIAMLGAVCIIVLSFDIFRGRRDTMYGAAVKNVGSVILLPPGVFVAMTGSDANSGTNFKAPFRTIPYALTRASALGMTNIYVAQGTYTRGSGINASGDGVVIKARDIRMIGGYTPLSYGWIRYSNDKSTLDGGMVDGMRIMSLSNATNVLIDGFVLTGGTNIDASALYLHAAVSNIISNIIIRNVGATAGTGACVYMPATAAHNLLFMTMMHTIATTIEHIYIDGPSNRFGGYYSNNTGNMLFRFQIGPPGNVISADISNNTLGTAVIYSQNGAASVLGTRMINNSATYGIYFHQPGSGNVSMSSNVIYLGITGAGILISSFGASPALIIQSNYFGSTATGIQESGSDTPGHTIKDNRFNTSLLANLYVDSVDGTIDNFSIADLNMAHIRHDAAVASGNITTTSPP